MSVDSSIAKEKSTKFLAWLAICSIRFVLMSPIHQATVLAPIVIFLIAFDFSGQSSSTISSKQFFAISPSVKGLPFLAII